MTTDNKRKTKKPAWREHVESIVMGIVLALIIRTFLVQAYKIPSGSMRPTLIEGDRILVNKVVYRFRAPARGDIIVFKYPEDPKRDFIKRLVGSPGDVVGIRDGRLIINGEIMDDPPFEAIGYANRGDLADPDAVVAVPPGMYFVLGDNSGSSRDSRYWGFVPQDDLVGRAEVIFWPLTRWRTIK